MNHMTVDGPDAPWNQVNLPEKEIEVTVSITLSKTMKVLVDDYKVETDEVGRPVLYNYDDCDLYKAVEEQVVLPQNIAGFTEGMFNHDLDLKTAGIPKYLKDAIADCKDWSVDEMEVVLE